MDSYEKKLKQQQRFQKRQQESAKRYKDKQQSKSKVTKKYNSVNKKYKPSGEKNMFVNIWNKRKHICCICGCNIHTMQTYCFAHIFPKGMYPEYKLTECNIALVCSIECHHKVDEKFAGIKYESKELIDKGTLPPIASNGQTDT